MRLLPLPSLSYMPGARTGARTCAQTRNFTASPAHLTTRLPPGTGNERRRHIWNMNDPTVVFPNLLAPVRLRPYNKQPGIPLGLPDDKLPEPWTCDWHAWGLLPSWYSCGGGEEIGGGEFDPRLFQLGIEDPVIPLMFRSTERSATSTVFAACVAQRLAFYLFDEPSDSVYRFEQDHPPQNASLEEFAESANWNRMTYLGFDGEDEHCRNSDIQCDGILRWRDLDKTSLWASEPRILRDPFAQREPTVDTVLRPTQCFFVPDTHLPEGWSCEWEHRPLSLILPIPTVSELQASFNLSTPLKPIMYRLGSDATIFESDGVFYVYGVGVDGEWLIPALYRFAGRFSSVEDFIEYSDWNRMEPLTFHDDPAPVSLASTKPTKQHNRPLKTGGVFRAAAERPYQKRTIWDICPPKDTWGYHPRVLRPRHRRGECPLLVERALKEWPRIPDAQLPEPWSSSWECWDYVADWYPQPHSGHCDPGHEATLYKVYGVAGLTPVMFMPDGQDRGPVILSAGEDYYFFNHEMDEWLKKFEGTYATVEDFIQNGDWNRMEFVKYVGSYACYDT